jgi:hypothetical protein
MPYTEFLKERPMRRISGFRDEQLAVRYRDQLKTMTQNNGDPLQDFATPSKI